MQYTEAVQLARKLRTERGLSPQKLAVELETAGYTNPKTGKPVTPAGAYFMATKARIRGRGTHRGRRTTGEPTKRQPSLRLVKSILATASLPESDRIALAQLVIGD